MRNPFFRRLRVRFAAVDGVFAHVADAVGDPLDVLLDRNRHVAKDRRAAGPGDGEQVGKPWHLQAQIGLRAGLPVIAQCHAVPAFDVQTQ